MGYLYTVRIRTAQFVHYDSYTKWNHKIAWIRSLVNRAKKLCSPNKLSNEIMNIKRFASYNGFPKWIVSNVIKRCFNTRKEKKNTDDTGNTLFMFLPYTGKEAEYIVKRCKKKTVPSFQKRRKGKVQCSIPDNKSFIFYIKQRKNPVFE